MIAEAQLIGIALSTAIISTDGIAWLTGHQLRVSTKRPAVSRSPNKIWDVLEYQFPLLKVVNSTIRDRAPPILNKLVNQPSTEALGLMAIFVYAQRSEVNYAG